jgi:hypothetical protein
MSLLDKVLNYVKSAGHAVESEEHKLLNEFAVYLASEKVALGFSDSPVVTSFATTLVPAPEPVQVAPVIEDPVEVPAETTISAPASITIDVPVESTFSVEVTKPVDPEQNVAS